MTDYNVKSCISDFKIALAKPNSILLLQDILAKIRNGGRDFLNFGDLFSFLLYDPVVKSSKAFSIKIEQLCVTDHL